MSQYHRVIVIGTTGSGKSTLARQIADRLGSHFIELDALYWEANWQVAAADIFRARVETAVQAEYWTAAGNYRTVIDLTWQQADTIIWLDYPMMFTLTRLWVRTWARWWSQEELWNGNREHLWHQFKLWSDDSLFHWFFKTYWRRKREFSLQLALPEYQSKTLHFKSQVETSAWLENLDSHVYSADQHNEYRCD